MTCSACGTEAPEENLFCEDCGARLASQEAQDGQAERCACGAPAGEVDEDGFCLGCGKRVRRPASDHIEQAVSADFAAISDRGLRHDRNEDRFALVEHKGNFALVVCDGVSSTRDAEVASGLAAQVIADALGEALLTETAASDPEILNRAFARAAAALVAESASSSGENVPSTTAVAALVRSETITIGWAGDSRAYWMDAEGAMPLTRDHSWLAAVLAAGGVTEAEANASPQAHAITRWLGADADPETRPEIVQHHVLTPGVLLLCTDGLWNYAPEPESLAQLFAAVNRNYAGGCENPDDPEDSDDRVEPDLLPIAHSLVAFANEQGGRDNVTVALLRLPVSRSQTDQVATGSDGALNQAT